MKRNIEKYTSAADAKRNILAFLAQHYPDSRTLAAKSRIGYAAYPDYDFKASQGAAFAVAKIVRDLEKEGLVGYTHRSYPLQVRGYYLTLKGHEAHAKQATPDYSGLLAGVRSIAPRCSLCDGLLDTDAGDGRSNSDLPPCCGPCRAAEIGEACLTATPK